MSKWQEKTKRPVLPVYMAALVWPIMALLVPIYTLGGLVLTAAVSAGVYFAGTKLCPTRVVRTYVPYATGSEDVDAITVDGVTVSSYTTRTERTGWGWWSPKVTYRVFTYTATAPAQTTDYAVCAVNAEGTASEPITATLTVRPATWWNWWF